MDIVAPMQTLGAGSLPVTTLPSREDFNRGVDLFNRGHFFDAHEVLEDVWRSLPQDSPARQHLRLHMQGLIQLAVAFHHQSTGNYLGARSVLERALRNLTGAERSFPDLDLDHLRAELALWRRYLDGSVGKREGAREAAPALPKIKPHR